MRHVSDWVSGAMLIAINTYKAQDPTLPEDDRVRDVLAAFVIALPNDIRVRDITPTVLDASQKVLPAAS